jgi:hypothetical protein
MTLIVAGSAVVASVAGAVSLIRDRHDGMAEMTIRPVVGRTLGPAYRADPASQHDAIARAPRVDAEPRPLAALAAALRAGGIVIDDHRRKELVLFTEAGGIPAAKIRVRDPNAVTAVSLVFRVRDTHLAIAAVHALVPVLGPLVLRGALVDLLVDGTRTRPELIDDFKAHMQAEIDKIKARLASGQAIIDQYLAATKKRD